MSKIFESIYLVPSLILLLSVATDLYAKKIYNILILSFLGLSIANHFLFLDGFSSLKFGLLAAVLAFSFMIPLFMAKMLGGGDLKLLVVFAINVTVSSLIYTFIYSLFWGMVLGLLMIILKKQSKNFINNTVGILKFEKPKSENLHTIPYSVALFFGWITQLSVTGLYFF